MRRASQEYAHLCDQAQSLREARESLWELDAAAAERRATKQPRSKLLHSVAELDHAHAAHELTAQEGGESGQAAPPEEAKEKEGSELDGAVDSFVQTHRLSELLAQMAREEEEKARLRAEKAKLRALERAQRKLQQQHGKVKGAIEADGEKAPKVKIPIFGQKVQPSAAAAGAARLGTGISLGARGGGGGAAATVHASPAATGRAPEREREVLVSTKTYAFGSRIDAGLSPVGDAAGGGGGGKVSDKDAERASKQLRKRSSASAAPGRARLGVPSSSNAPSPTPSDSSSPDRSFLFFLGGKTFSAEAIAAGGRSPSPWLTGKPDDGDHNGAKAYNEEGDGEEDGVSEEERRRRRNLKALAVQGEEPPKSPTRPAAALLLGAQKRAFMDALLQRSTPFHYADLAAATEQEQLAMHTPLNLQRLLDIRNNASSSGADSKNVLDRKKRKVKRRFKAKFKSKMKRLAMDQQSSDSLRLYGNSEALLEGLQEGEEEDDEDDEDEEDQNGSSGGGGGGGGGGRWLGEESSTLLDLDRRSESSSLALDSVGGGGSDYEYSATYPRGASAGAGANGHYQQKNQLDCRPSGDAGEEDLEEEEEDFDEDEVDAFNPDGPSAFERRQSSVKQLQQLQQPVSTAHARAPTQRTVLAQKYLQTMESWNKAQFPSDTPALPMQVVINITPRREFDAAAHELRRLRGSTGSVGSMGDDDDRGASMPMDYSDDPREEWFECDTGVSAEDNAGEADRYGYGEIAFDEEVRALVQGAVGRGGLGNPQVELRRESVGGSLRFNDTASSSTSSTISLPTLASQLKDGSYAPTCVDAGADTGATTTAFSTRGRHTLLLGPLGPVPHAPYGGEYESSRASSVMEGTDDGSSQPHGASGNGIGNGSGARSGSVGWYSRGSVRGASIIAGVGTRLSQLSRFAAGGSTGSSSMGMRVQARQSGIGMTAGVGVGFGGEDGSSIDRRSTGRRSTGRRSTGRRSTRLSRHDSMNSAAALPVAGTSLAAAGAVGEGRAPGTSARSVHSSSFRSANGQSAAALLARLEQRRQSNKFVLGALPGIGSTPTSTSTAATAGGGDSAKALHPSSSRLGYVSKSSSKQDFRHLGLSSSVAGVHGVADPAVLELLSSEQTVASWRDIDLFHVSADETFQSHEFHFGQDDGDDQRIIEAVNEQYVSPALRLRAAGGVDGRVGAVHTRVHAASLPNAPKVPNESNAPDASSSSSEPFTDNAPTALTTHNPAALSTPPEGKPDMPGGNWQAEDSKEHGATSEPPSDYFGRGSPPAPADADVNATAEPSDPPAAMSSKQPAPPSPIVEDSSTDNSSDDDDDDDDVEGKGKGKGKEGPIDEAVIAAAAAAASRLGAMGQGQVARPPIDPRPSANTDSPRKRFSRAALHVPPR